MIHITDDKNTAFDASIIVHNSDLLTTLIVVLVKLLVSIVKSALRWHVSFGLIQNVRERTRVIVMISNWYKLTTASI